MPLLRCLLLLCLTAPAWALDVRFPQPESDQDVRFRYPYELLKLALEATRPDFGPYTLRMSDEPLNRQRQILELTQPDGRVTVSHFVTTTELEQQLTPIRVPIDKGLLGYRLLLIRADDQQRLRQVRTLDELKKLRFGMGETWSITPAFRQAGFNLVTSTDYESLFKMLVGGRFDAFPRGLDEAQPEWQARRAALPQLHIDDSLLLYLPAPRYLFTGRDPAGQALARRIEVGLTRLRASGGFDKLFDTYLNSVLASVSLKGRRVFRLDNPVLPPATPLDRAELWWRPPE